jgi:protein-tyrosine phosphatase
MRPELFTIDRDGAAGRLSTMARPRGGSWLAEEVTALSRDGVDRLVCLLTDNELVELHLTNEARLAGDSGIDFLRFPVPDLGLPAPGPTIALAHELAQDLLADRSVVVQCRAGIGRSSLLAASVLRAEGRTTEEAWQLIAEARGLPVPDTDEQRDFLVALEV